MPSYSKIILLGNLCRDPELKYLPSGDPVVEIGMAVNTKWKGKDGQQKEDTCFISCVMFGKRAEVLNQYVKKGDLLLVEGRLKFEQWDAPDGTKRSKHKVHISNFEFMGKPEQKPQANPNPAYNPDGFTPEANDPCPF